MKITAKNIVDNWLDVKPLLPEELAKLGEDSFLPFAEMYDDFDEEMAQSFDMFLEKVNKFANNAKKSPKRKYVKGKGGKITGRRKKGEPKPKKEKKKVKKETSQKTKKEKKEKKEKTQKTSKPKVGEAPKWLKTLESFVKSFAGKTKDTWRVRNFVSDIQAYFSKKHGNSTPNIDLITEIQDKLIKYANSDSKKVTIPDYTDLVSKCKTAIKSKDFTISNKVKKSDLKNAELSGFSTGFNNLSGFKIGFGK